MSTDNFKAQHRGGKGIKGMETIEDDYIVEMLMTTSHHYLMFFTNTGRVYRIKAYEIPEASRTSRGTAIINLIPLQPDEKITAMIPIKEYEDDKYLFMATRNGIVKKTPIKDYENIRKNGLAAINLREDRQTHRGQGHRQFRGYFALHQIRTVYQIQGDRCALNRPYNHGCYRNESCTK